MLGSLEEHPHDRCHKQHKHCIRALNNYVDYFEELVICTLQIVLEVRLKCLIITKGSTKNFLSVFFVIVSLPGLDTNQNDLANVQEVSQNT